MADSSSLNVVLTANFKRLEQDLQKAGLVAEKAVADIEDKFAKANPKLGSAALLGGFAGGALSGVVSGLVDKIAELPGKIIEANRELANLGDTARRVGLSTDQLQATQFIGRQNGISGDQTNQAMKGFASAIAGANEEGSKLGQLLADNGIKIANAAGKQRSLNDLLADAARLLQGAATEQQKIDITKLLGLSEDWIRVLEKGPEAFRAGQAMAAATGNIIGTELIQKAQQFDEAWSRGFTNFTALAKSAAINAAQAFRDFLAVANVVSDPNIIARKAQDARDLANKNSPDSLKGSYFAQRAGQLDDQLEAQLKPELDRAKRALAIEMSRQAQEATAKANGGFKPGVYGDLVRPKATNANALNKPAKSGASSGLSEEDIRYNKEVDYIAQLEKAGRILDAEIASVGLSNAERAKAIELARIGGVTDAAHLATINADVDANERKRQKLEQINLALRGQRDAAQFAGDQLSNAFDSLLDGGKIEDAINGITKALAKAAIQAALLGQGPLAGLLGTAGGSSTGGIGGIIGALLPARASGGPVQSGKTYLVGENGPEMVRFGRNGSVTPNGVISGGGSTPRVEFHQVNQSGAQASQPEVSSGPDGRLIIRQIIREEFGTDLAKNGPIAQSFQGRYGVSRSSGRR